MTDCAGEWYVCVCAECALRDVLSVVPKCVQVWRKRVSMSRSRVKLVVRWSRPVKLRYVEHVLGEYCLSVKPWSGECEYQASQATRVEVMNKLRSEYIKVYSGDNVYKEYNMFKC